MSQAVSALHMKFGLFDVNLQAGELRKQGLKLKLGRNALKVLGLLLQHPGELLTREEIRQALWGANTFVTFDQGINKAIHELRRAFGDPSNDPHYIETVPGRGYRFIHSPQASRQETKKHNHLHSIAVLPFATEPADRETELFSKRLVELLIDIISQVPGLSVLAYSTVQQYRREDLNPEAVRKSLGVRIAILGELTRSQDKLLLHVELVDVCHGTQLWGGEFKRSFARIQPAPGKLADQIWNRVRPILILKASKRSENGKIYQMAA
jgi:DNA-binding winged helix-turn-helix (wHTH) protein